MSEKTPEQHRDARRKEQNEGAHKLSEKRDDSEPVTEDRSVQRTPDVKARRIAGPRERKEGDGD